MSFILIIKILLYAQVVFFIYYFPLRLEIAIKKPCIKYTAALNAFQLCFSHFHFFVFMQIQLIILNKLMI